MWERRRDPKPIAWSVALALASALALPDLARAVCVDAPENLVAWWPAEGNADDLVGQNDGSLATGTTFDDGEVGQAFRFDGTTGAVMVPASEALNVGTGPGFTIELWVNPDQDAGREPLVEWNRQSGTPNFGVHLWVNTRNNDPDPHPGNLYANIHDTSGTSHVFFSADGHVTEGSFQHVALTYDKASGVARLYHDGAPIAESGLGTFTPQTSYDLFFASRPGPTQPTKFGGALDEISLYDRALTPAEILALRDAGSSGKCVALCGDANGDGDITAGDALFVLRAAVGAVTCALCVCDVNDSTTISAGDALTVLRSAVGAAAVLTCPVCLAD